MNLLRRAPGWILLTLCAGAAQGQEPLTMDKAVQVSLEQNHQLKGATHDLSSAHWGKLNALTSFLPKVEVSGSLTRIDPQSEAMANAAVDFIKLAASSLGIPPSALANMKPFAYRDTYATDVTVVQPVYNGGAEIVGLRAANALQDKSEYSLEDTEQDVIATVRISYLSALKAMELVALTKESAERTKRYLEMTRRRASVGMRTQTDVLRWEVQLASDEGGIVNAENFLSAARLQLNEAMGVDLNREYALQPVVLPDSASGRDGAAPLLASIDPLGAGAVSSGEFLERHPSMKVVEANLRLADINIDKSWVNFQPRVNLAFQYGWEKNNTLALDGIRPWAIALSVSSPIFNGFGDYTGLQKANAEYKSAEEQVERFRRGLVMQATNAALNVKAAGKRTEIARKAQEEALDVLNSVSRRYETGGASNVDLIDVQTAYTSAKTSFITATYDEQIARVQLARATGKISR